MKKYLVTGLLLCVFFSVIILPQKKNISEELIMSRVDSVLSLMTLEEKIGQLNQFSYGIGWGPTIKVSVPNE